MTKGPQRGRRGGAIRKPSGIWLERVTRALNSELFRSWLGPIQAILALVAIVIAAYGIHEAREMGDASLQWQRQVWALQRTSLTVDRTLKYGDDEGIIGKLTIQNQGPAHAVSVILRINSVVPLKVAPVIEVGPRGESMQLDQTRKTWRYEIGDLMKDESAVIEVELEPSSIATQNALLGFYPFENPVGCQNCDEAEYAPTELVDFPELPAGQEYTIKPGDVITDVLKPYGLTPWDLELWNPDLDITQIHPGQTIIIPPPTIW